MNLLNGKLIETAKIRMNGGMANNSDNNETSKEQQTDNNYTSIHPALYTSKVAFTLAEVLITLGIIGVVSAITMPTVITKYQEQKTVTQLNKVYSVMSQAWQMMQAEYGTIDTWGMSNTDTGLKDENENAIYDHSAQKLIVERLKPYLKIARTCEAGKTCDMRDRYNLKGEKIGKGGSIAGSGDCPAEGMFYLADGTGIFMGWFVTNSIDFDVILPGNKRILGKSEFYFNGSPKGIVPEGKDSSFKNRCNLNANGTYVGRGCTAWVIYNKNMDYLHCNDLSWDGKTKCK